MTEWTGRQSNTDEAEELRAGENQQRELARDLAKQAAEFCQAMLQRMSKGSSRPTLEVMQVCALASIALSLAWRDRP